MSVRTLFDTRDNPINPSSGWYAHASYLMFFEGFLGGTSDWQQFSYGNTDGRPTLPGRPPQARVLALR